MIITNLTYEEALALPEPKEIYVDETGVYVYTEEHMSPRPNPVPQEVYADQARNALRDAGLLDAVDQYIAQSNDVELKTRWEFRGVFRRDSASVAAISTALGLTDAQVDELFIRAASK